MGVYVDIIPLMGVYGASHRENPIYKRKPAAQPQRLYSTSQNDLTDAEGTNTGRTRATLGRKNGVLEHAIIGNHDRWLNI